MEIRIDRDDGMDESLARYRPYLAMTLLFIITLIGTIYVLRRPEPAALTITTSTPRATATLAPIVIDVRGAVAKPNVYSLPPGSRVQDALVLAGGALDTADIRTMNLARKLNDGEQIYIPAMGEATLTPAAGTAPFSKTPFGKLVNVNTATAAELDALPGIGPTYAQRIVDYRTQNDPFNKIEDIKKVRGIGDALFEQIKNLITVQ